MVCNILNFQNKALIRPFHVMQPAFTNNSEIGTGCIAIITGAGEMSLTNLVEVNFSLFFKLRY